MRFIQANILNIALSGGLSALNMLLSIIEARILGPEKLGNYQVFVSTQTIVFTIFAFGLGNAGIYFINSGKSTPKEYVSTVLRLEIVLAIIVFLSLFCIVYFNTSYFGILPMPALILYCIGSGFTLFTTAITPVLLARYEIYKYQAIGYVTSLLSIAAIYMFFLLKGSFDISLMLIIAAVCKIISALTLLWFIRLDIDFSIPFKIDSLVKYLKFGIQFSMSNVAYILILNIPIYAITFLISDGFDAVGYFTRATAICTLAIFVNKQIGPLLFAKLSSCTDNEKIENTRLMATFFVIFNSIMIVGVFICAKIIVTILYGEQYLPSVPLVRLMAISIFFTGITELVNNLFSAIGKPRYILYNLIIGIIVLIPCITLSLKLLGINGAPIAVTVVNCITALLLIASLKKHLPINFSDFFWISRERIQECCRTLKSNLSNR